MSVAGSGEINAAGRIEDLTISISGSGSCNAADLKARRAKVAVRGSGDLTVNASGRTRGDRVRLGLHMVCRLAEDHVEHFRLGIDPAKIGQDLCAATSSPVPRN